MPARMPSSQEHASTRRRMMDRQDEQGRHAFRSLRGPTSSNIPVTAFGLENVRIGGDEKKLRTHYGFNAGDLGNNSSVSNNFNGSTSAPFIRSIDSNEYLRNQRVKQRRLSHSKSQERLRDAAFDENGVRPKARDAPKFSFRKVFGLNGTEQSGVDRVRDSVYLYDAEV